MKAGDVVKARLPSGETYAVFVCPVAASHGRRVLVRVTGIVTQIARNLVSLPPTPKEAPRGR